MINIEPSKITINWHDLTPFEIPKLTILLFLSIVTFKLTVTEEKDKSHTSSIDVKVNLIDLNDNPPKFQDVSQPLNIKEDVISSTLVYVIVADDNDISSKFNKESIV